MFRARDWFIQFRVYLTCLRVFVLLSFGGSEASTCTVGWNLKFMIPDL